MRSLADSDDYPILDENLSRLPIDSGICLGESLDFISLYLNDTSEDKFEVIKKISEQFSEKGTEKAHILQILHRAQNTAQLAQNRSNYRAKLLKEQEQKKEILENKLKDAEKKQKETFKDIKDSNKTDSNKSKKLSPDKKASLLEEIGKAIEEFNNAMITFQEEAEKMREDFLLTLGTFNATLDNERLQQIAKANDLQLKLKMFCHIEDITEQEAPINKFNASIADLPEGAYLWGLNPCGPESKHVIVFIKTPTGVTYSFDPNLATVKFKNSQEFAADLWKLTQKLYNTKGTCTLAVHNCTLT